MDKYRRLRQRVVQNDRHRNDVLVVPPEATDDQLRLCHDQRYVGSVVDGTLTAAEIRRIGFPWSPKMVQRSRRSTGATIAASRAAIQDGISVNLAGGTHHAMHAAGEGYCVFNDAAVAIRTLQQQQVIRRACVIDLDVHQGNGTAEILSNDPTAFTFSMHGVKNFPLRKTASDLDVSLPDGTDDAPYLNQLQSALRIVESAGPFDLAIYLAGADPYVDDRLGRLALTKSGLRDRDEMLIQWATERSIPLAIAMAGGYAADIDDIVDIHASTVASAAAASVH
ncbi:Histone deacetylase-like amidohydrolase [Rubripirellula lacrimiformis]|uniref:Histone deacetylase-like amidohydrolase n=2 Tax=Rubripirellula lacrimiformis TaxID=1930273 RepID=A0A517NFN0_9BACT|nr:Histone deacetylase-like amidohydrolase [Rubripirellula lacrimiformis]